MENHLKKSNSKVDNFCQIHRSATFEYFCISKNCIQPLCASCLEEHTWFHKQNNSEMKLENIENIQGKCKIKLNKTFDIITNKMENFFTSNYVFSTQSILDEGMEIIEKNKNKIINKISNFFEEFKVKYKNSLKPLVELEESYTTIFEKLQGFINRLQYYIVKIETNNSFEFLKKICKLNMKDIINKAADDIEFLKKKENFAAPNIIMDEKIFHEIKSSLEKSIYLEDGRKITKIKLKPYRKEIALENYLPFFVSKTKLLYLFNLSNYLDSPDKIKKEKPDYFEKFELKIEENIPDYHESISISNQIYMITESDILEYIGHQKKLILKNQLINNRMYYSICSNKNSIYFFGGISKDDPKLCMNECEQFDIGTRDVSPLKKMLMPSAFCSICTFKNKYIYLFGGITDGLEPLKKIFRYDILKDDWKEVDASVDFAYNLSYKYFSINSMHQKSIQINKNDILILSGSRDIKNFTNSKNINYIFSKKKKTLFYLSDSAKLQNLKSYKFYGVPIKIQQRILIFGKALDDEDIEMNVLFIFDSELNEWFIQNL